MSDFNEWCRDNHPDCNPQFIYGGLVWKSRQAEVYKLQAEIDELRKEANKEREQATEYFTDLEFANAKCRELQKRIDNALSFADDVHSENWQETLNTMLYILKGEKQ